MIGVIILAGVIFGGIFSIISIIISTRSHSRYVSENPRELLADYIGKSLVASIASTLIFLFILSSFEDNLYENLPIVLFVSLFMGAAPGIIFKLFSKSLRTP